jgi:predicted dehydrogenase
MSKTYRAALIGCGRMGATIDDEVRDHPNSFLWLPYSHAAGYVACERTALVAVSDPIPEKVAEIQARYSVAAGYTDYRELIEKERPDIVSIATRPGPHAEIVIFAAEHGVRGIYCEKPLCCSMREADAMRAAVEKSGVKFNYGTQRRYMPLYHTMRALIDAGELGTVNAVIGHCGVSAAQWGHTHAADMLLYLAGDGEIDYVQGTTLAKDTDWEGSHLTVDPGIASAYVHFRNGVHGYLVAAGGYEFEVSGPKGKLRSCENGTSAQWRRAEGKHNLLVDVPFPAYTHASGTVRGIEDIVAALDSGGETLGNIGIACRSQEMILAIIESSRLGGVRVSLPLEHRDLKVARKDW